MIYRLVDAKPVSDPTRDYCKVHHWKQTKILTRNIYIFIEEKAFENVVRKMAVILCRPQIIKYNIIGKSVAKQQLRGQH